MKINYLNTLRESWGEIKNFLRVVLCTPCTGSLFIRQGKKVAGFFLSADATRHPRFTIERMHKYIAGKNVDAIVGVGGREKRRKAIKIRLSRRKKVCLDGGGRQAGVVGVQEQGLIKIPALFTFFSFD